MMHDENTYLSAENLSVGYGNIPLLENLSLHAGSSQVIALTGPNGTGKSTLLKTLMGLIPALSGELNIMEQNPANMPPRKKAQLVSFVAANAGLPSNLYVHELVAYGRYPYGGLLSRITQEDKIKQQRAMNQMLVDHLAGRRIGEISDGEKQRVMIARALAQDTPLVILDEPAAHLDIKNRYELMKLLSRQAAVFGKCIIFSTHDLEIMLNNSDLMWMIDNKSIVSGLPEDLVMQGKIDDLVPSEQIVFDMQSGKFTMPVRKSATVCLQSKSDEAGNVSARAYHRWTAHALDRYGFSVECNKTGDINVIINIKENNVNWECLVQDNQIQCKSVQELILKLKKHIL
ncbi:MAG: ABC transporter ATP-binding protein [Candidatus Delongbacteria bacterium]|jgi:iron complex transport system ATP-binding protein|nr:ABC transporter ATP-binding protein [Candidatus Delongbacteria bacterium]